MTFWCQGIGDAIHIRSHTCRGRGGLSCPEDLGETPIEAGSPGLRLVFWLRQWIQTAAT